MKTNLAKLGLLALAVGALAPSLANAQTNNGTPQSSYSPGDLVVGFYNASTEYSLDLGPLSDFNFSSSFEIPNSSTSIGTDLSTAFGSWYGSSTVYFGLAADNGATSNPVVFYATNPVGNAAWTAAGSEASAANSLNNFGTVFTNNAPTGGSYVSQGLEEPDTTAGGWYASVHGSSGVAFGTYQDLGSPVGDGAISALTSGTSNFDQMTFDGGSNYSESTLGTWKVDSTGDLIYTAAVPEPSSIATVILGAAALVGFRFRRRA